MKSKRKGQNINLGIRAQVSDAQATMFSDPHQATALEKDGISYGLSSDDKYNIKEDIDQIARHKQQYSIKIKQNRSQGSSFRNNNSFVKE